MRLTGRRIGVGRKPTAGDTFVHEETVEGVVPDTGPVSVTSTVYGVEEGDWTVTAELVGPPGRVARRTRDGRGVPSSERLPRAAWSWRRWAVKSGLDTPVKTRWALVAPLARSPAVLPMSFTVLAALGILAAVVSQAVILAHEDLSVSGGLTATALAIVSGVIGAKVWFVMLQARPWRDTIRQGWSVDGFLVVAVVVAVVAVLGLNLPIGRYLDTTAPGIFFAVAIGRIGCFLTGCCAGRCTASRWGIWSSDHRVGARRIPTQLLEAGAGLVLGVVSTLVLFNDAVAVDGLVFVATLAAYIVVRQGLLRLRAESRRYSWRRSRLATQGRS